MRLVTIIYSRPEDLFEPFYASVSREKGSSDQEIYRATVDGQPLNARDTFAEAMQDASTHVSQTVEP